MNQGLGAAGSPRPMSSLLRAFVSSPFHSLLLPDKGALAILLANKLQREPLRFLCSIRWEYEFWNTP